MNFVPDPNAPPEMEMVHRDGIPYYQAPTPRFFHRCTPWTKGYSGLYPIWRCACGAISMDQGRHWDERRKPWERRH